MEALKKLIEPKDKSVREVLDNIKYSIDFFQREYTWERKHVEQLIIDLTEKFFANYEKNDHHYREEVENYTRYYLGSILLCLKDGKKSIIDGQQRLTTVTLLLIYLNNLQKGKTSEIKKVSELIFSEKFSKKSFNMQVEDRADCMEALYNGEDYDPNGKGESVKHIVDRYEDINELFPDDLKEEALPYFIDWLMEYVVFVEITTYSDDDAYTIFETMNDRGKSLTPTDMLKGYILVNVAGVEKKDKINEFWKSSIFELKKIEETEDLDFFKAWLRAKYAETIRPGKKGAENEDFEKIGSRFHSWVRDNKEKLNLVVSDDFYNLIMKYFAFFTKLYLKIFEATDKLIDKFESIHFIEERGLALSIYFPLLMAPVKPDDTEDKIDKKLQLVSYFLEMFVVFRSINRRNYSHSGIRYTMYNLVKEIRNKSIEELAQILKSKVREFEDRLDGMKSLVLHGQNRRFIRFLLARITTHIENQSGIPTKFNNYVDPDLKKPFEIEHIWANSFEEHRDEFEQRDEFENFRNSIGALLLVQRGFNQSYGDLSYEEKLSHYYGQNLLAKSLNQQCYDRNPNFINYIKNSNLPFKYHQHFKRKDILDRIELYTAICEEIYNIEKFDLIVSGNEE
ncbi:DUF262 domain-containing protein [Candidatus Woesearchaeota archaeon]|nr:DUF262 domain-containing protein [Candidatus Woesearchaeota archaeon]